MTKKAVAREMFLERTEKRLVAQLDEVVADFLGLGYDLDQINARVIGAISRAMIPIETKVALAELMSPK